MEIFQRLTPQMMGRIQRLPDGRTTVYHEKLDWNSPSKLRSYSLGNLGYKPHQSDIKVMFVNSISLMQSKDNLRFHKKNFDGIVNLE